jgi:hypothetical protein
VHRIIQVKIPAIEPSSTAANPEKNYLLPVPFHDKEILNIAGELYDNLLKAVVDNTIYPAIPANQ